MSVNGGVDRGCGECHWGSRLGGGVNVTGGEWTEGVASVTGRVDK